MLKQKYVYSCIVVLAIGLSAWVLSIINCATYAWLVSFPAGIGIIFLAIKIRGEDITGKITKRLFIGLGILLTTSFYFVFPVISMVDDVSKGYDDKNIVVLAPIKGATPIKAGGSNDLDKCDNKVRIVYFTKTNCPACESFSEVLEKVIQKNKAKVYYYNTEEMPKKESSKYVKKFRIKYVPMLMKIKNGKVVSVFENSNSHKKIAGFLK